MGETRLLDAADWTLAALLMLLGLGLRLVWFSGYGLGDDILFRHDLHTLLTTHQVPADNMAYRVTWWLPTAVTCRLFGVGEAGLLTPVIAVTTAGIGVLYAFGRMLWGRPGGVIAAALLIVTPFDFAWATMMNLDAFCSVFSALCLLFFLRALAADDPVARRRAWVAAAVSLWLAFHAKVSAVFLVPALLVIAWSRRDRIDRTARAFVGTAVLLFGISAVASYVFTGDVLAPYHVEITTQGLQGDVAIQFHRLNADTFWAYPRWLLRPDRYGHLLFGLVPQTLLVLAALGPLLGLRSAWPIFWWFAFVFLGMEFNIQRVAGVWIAGFRNLRHAHVFIYPLILLLTGYLVSLRARRPWAAAAIIALLIAVGGWQSIATARVTRVSFADRRAVCRILQTMPPKTVVSDFQIETWCGLLDMHGLAFRSDLHSFDPSERRKQIALLGDVYLVTGGGREPYFGCIDCIPLAAELDPTQWRLLAEVPGPDGATPWRAEPARIWTRAAAAP